ncbi:MAG: NADH-quinone oxidoreductase subunit I [Phycisphaeraceae bacterium]|nr:NADH-quinone oxidoreductase subunit I [Phycisphaeraceae bacterium]
MPIKDQDVLLIAPTPISRSEAMYLPEVFKGLGTTFKHVLGSIGRGRMNRAMCYPEERREDLPVEKGGLYKPNFRGVHRLNRDEEGRVRCVACFMCSTACPAHCIHIEAGPAPWDDREKYPVKFDLDELRCIFCGMCEEACPVDAIELTPTYDIVGLTRQEMIFDKQKLLAVYDQTISNKPM